MSDEIKERLVESALPHVAFDGWSEASFEAAAAGGTLVRFEQEIALDLPVNRMVGRMLGPVFQKLMAPGVRAYLDRMVAPLM